MLASTYQFGDVLISGATLVAGGAAVLLLVLLAITFFAWRKAVQRVEVLEETREEGIAAGLAELRRHQGEITGQVRGLTDRLDGFGHRVGQSMSESARGTHESLAKLGERLAVIDKAQRTITDLSSQVVELQHILANKQQRGAFGQGRMEAIVRDGLPASGYEFQATLSNGNRPDCLILFPNGGPSLVIDAKFPLEGWSAIRAAETPEAKKAAESQFRRDTIKHVQDIAERYLLTGETQDTAFMFVPSESIFFDIHERFEDIVQRAHRARVVIVSPSLLMLSIQVVMSLLRDARMREQAHIIQQEVIRLMDDVGRLDDRVRKLGVHFSQANKDIEDILTSSRKITSRGDKIKAVEVADGDVPAPPRRGAGSPCPGPAWHAAATAVLGIRGSVAAAPLDPAAGSEPPAALEKLQFLRGRFAAKHRIAVGEAAELADDVAVFGGVVELVAGGFQMVRRHFQRALGIELDRHVLIGDDLAVLEGQHDEGLLGHEEASPMADKLAGDGKRGGIAGKGFAAVAVDLARELVEQDDKRDLLAAGERRKLPVGVAGGEGVGPPGVADMGVGLRRRAEPLGPPRFVGLLVPCLQVAEPIGVDRVEPVDVHSVPLFAS